MLLVVMYPRNLGWRLPVGLVLAGLAAFLAQHPGYVVQQYHEWIETRLHDNRHLYEQRLAPRDLWLVFTVLHVPVSAMGYKVLQVLTGGAIAVYAVLSRRDKGATGEELAGVLMLVCCWMLLFGPATESATYLLLAPVVVFSLTWDPKASGAGWMRVGAWAAYVILMSALALNSFTHRNRDAFSMIIQPIGALVFTLYSVGWLSRRAGSSSPAPHERRLAGFGLRHAGEVGKSMGRIEASAAAPGLAHSALNSSR
jgi:hypothetical protein